MYLCLGELLEAGHYLSTALILVFPPAALFSSSSFHPCPLGRWGGDASSAASRLVRVDSCQITDVLHRDNCLPKPLH